MDLLDESRYQTLLANPGLLAMELRDLLPQRWSETRVGGFTIGIH